MCPFLSCGQYISLNILTLVPLLGALFHPGASKLYLIFFEVMVETFGSSGCLQGNFRCTKTQNAVRVVNPEL